VVTLLAVFDEVAGAAQSVSDIIAAGIVPATLEMMDATVMRAVEESKPCGYPLDAAAVLIAEVDGPAVGLSQQAERVRQLCTKNRCREVRRAKDAGERDRLWAGRRGAFGAIARLAPSFLVSDCTVPRTLLPEALRRVAAIAEKHGLSHGNVFHAGDGNLHPLLLFDSRDPDQLHRVHQAGQEIMEACVALGGTITGEHGVGVEKSDAMRLVFSEDDLDYQRRIRSAFDPDDLLNPGKILPPAGNGEPISEPAMANLPQDGELLPADVAEARDMVRRAYLDRVALLPQGNGTQPDFGNPWIEPVTRLRSTRLSGVIEHDPANQVVAVGSGMSLKSLQDLLAENGQWLPVRPPGGSEHTLGGIVALAACGPERLRYGAPRDLLLGLKFVSGTGREISAGGRVVKNVAGYDVTRLLVGSAGTLGLLTQLTFRVLSLPERCAELTGCGPLERCAEAAAELIQSKLEATFVVAVPDQPDLQAGAGDRWKLMAGFEGFEQTVEFQTQSCRQLFRTAGLDVGATGEYPPREGKCGAWFEKLSRSAYLLQMDFPPDEVAGLLTTEKGVLGGAAALADFGNGRLMASLPDLTAERFSQLCQSAEKSQGHVFLARAPDPFRQQHDVFGPPRAQWQLMHRIKAALDPHGVFAPGRMPGRR
jgi:FAD/FMN-containing dehydrogenase